MTTFFTADYHLGHANICLYAHRAFYTSEDVVNDEWISREAAHTVSQAMNAEIVHRHNAVVGKHDTVYFLGDLAFGRNTVPWALDNLNGNFKFVIGNHDKQLTQFLSTHTDTRWEILPAETEIDLFGHHIVLGHYRMCCWNRMHYGSWHLHGHSHDAGSNRCINKKSMDVGIDVSQRVLGEYRPFRFDELEGEMIKKTFVPTEAL